MDVNEKEKERLGDELNRLTAFHATLADSRQTIAEKTYYYASVREELDAVRDGGVHRPTGFALFVILCPFPFCHSERSEDS